jgi:hypothetical protein
LPFSMVGDSAGISTWIGMSAPGTHSLGFCPARIPITKPIPTFAENRLQHQR